MANLCPTCHSDIGTDSTSTSGRIQGVQGTDSEGNPVPKWSNDPIFTKFGLNGSPYEGRDNIRVIHIKEIQTILQDLETELGITPQTAFSDIDIETKPARRHIIELRESTEKILNSLGLTLEDYFKTDSEGNDQPQNPKIAELGGNDPQDEWIDTNRGELYIHTDGSIGGTFTLPDSTTQQSPTLPSRIHIRAIHIEDLRHPIVVGIPAILVEAESGTLYKATKRGAVTFVDAELC